MDKARWTQGKLGGLSIVDSEINSGAGAGIQRPVTGCMLSPPTQQTSSTDWLKQVENVNHGFRFLVDSNFGRIVPQWM